MEATGTGLLSAACRGKQLNKFMKLLKTITALSLILITQFAVVSAQNSVGFVDVQKLYDEKNYRAVLSAIDPLIAQYDSNYKNDKDFAETLSKL